MKNSDISKRYVKVTWDSGNTFRSLGYFDFASCDSFAVFLLELEKIAGQTVFVINDDFALFNFPGESVLIEVAKPIDRELELVTVDFSDLPRRMQPGWKYSIRNWVEQVTSDDVKEFTQISQYFLTSTVRCTTDLGTFFVKASESKYESVVTEVVHKYLPLETTRFISKYPDEECFICKSEGNELAGESCLDSYHQALVNIAKLHQISSKLIPDLEALSIATETPRDSLIFFRGLLDSPEKMSAWGISEGKQLELASQRDELICLFEKVSEDNSRIVFNHGDSHHKNAIVHNGSVRWFDWGDCIFAHPGYDLGWFLAYFDNQNVGSVSKEQRSDAYMSELVRSYSSESDMNYQLVGVKALKVFALISRISVYGRQYDDVFRTKDTFVPGYVRFFVSMLLKANKSEF